MTLERRVYQTVGQTIEDLLGVVPVKGVGFLTGDMVTDAYTTVR